MDDYVASSGADIAIAVLLHEQGDTADRVVSDGDQEEEEGDGTSDDDGDARNLLSPCGQRATEK
jgi:hypothetical protein